MKLIGLSSRYPDAPILLAFLGTCRDLTELEIQSSTFRNADLYDQLSRVLSCQTLLTLALFSEPGAFEHRIDFSFLSAFPLLRRFRTNLAIREKMRDLLSKGLKAGQKFSFQFHTDNTGKHHLFDIRNTGATDSDSYTLEVKFLSAQGVCSNEVSGLSFALDTLLAVVESEREWSYHWLDPKPKRELEPATERPSKRLKTEETSDHSV